MERRDSVIQLEVPSAATSDTDRVPMPKCGREKRARSSCGSLLMQEGRRGEVDVECRKVR